MNKLVLGKKSALLIAIVFFYNKYDAEFEWF
jgi:hypothetical protein